MMKKSLILLSIIIGLTSIFFPAIRRKLEWKMAVEAASGMPIYEGYTAATIAQCQCIYVYGVCVSCQGTGACILDVPTGNMCTGSGLQVTMSAGGLTCPSGYLLNSTQVGTAQGASNSIIGGTTCNTLSVVATERGCVGCTALSEGENIFAKAKDIIVAIFK